jgi:hypothetical protein
MEMINLNIAKRYSAIIILLLSLISILFLSKLVLAENQKNFVRCNFIKILKIDSWGLDVFCLQVLLYQEGFLQNPLKSAAYYNSETEKAVREWQIKNNIMPANGVFGNSSIAFYNKFYLRKFEKSLLTLPEIKDEEIKISSQGYSNSEDYIKFYLTGFNKNLTKIINQDSEMLQYLKTISVGTEKKKEVLSFSPYVYIKNYLTGGINIDDLNRKLIFLRKFYEIKINELKKIEVDAKLKDFHKKFIVNDYLEITLIDKFDAYRRGEISKDDLDQILSKYEKFKNKLVLEVQSFAVGRNRFLLSFFIKTVEAIASSYTPFGGRILSVTNCTCSSGYTDIIGPPRFAIIFIPYTFSSSPLNSLWRQITTEGVWALGLYTTPPEPCLIWVGEACESADVQPWGTIHRSGTSLIPWR